MPTASVLANAEVRLDPYPVAICSPALPWRLYEALEESRPGMDWILAERKAGENERIDMPTVAALSDASLPTEWREFMAYHAGRKFVKEVCGLFGFDFDRSLTVGPRGTGAGIGTECQLGVNTPSQKEGRVRGPHLDNPVELYGGLLYMNDDDTDFIVYRLKEPARFHGKLEIDDDCCAEVVRVPCRRNVAVFFRNGPTAVHGISPRAPSKSPRLLVNFIAEQREPLFRVGHGMF